MRRQKVETASAAAELSQAKAKLVSARHPGQLIIGADQILDLDGAWFDKPRDLAGAEDHLKRLQGRTHCLVSAVCVVRDNECLWNHVETARLTMRSLSPGFLERYLAETGPEILESVGAYRVEGMGIQLFSRIDGNHFTILGLPLLPLLDILRRQGVIEA